MFYPWTISPLSFSDRKFKESSYLVTFQRKIPLYPFKRECAPLAHILLNPTASTCSKYEKVWKSERRLVSAKTNLQTPKKEHTKEVKR